jgi:hypothetical protein
MPDPILDPSSLSPAQTREMAESVELIAARWHAIKDEALTLRSAASLLRALAEEGEKKPRMVMDQKAREHYDACGLCGDGVLCDEGRKLLKPAGPYQRQA